MNRLGVVTLLLVAACSDTELQRQQFLGRPSGMAVIPREPQEFDGQLLQRADVLVADAESDGVRVLQLWGEFQPFFLQAPVLLQSLLVTAPGFPTRVTWEEGSSEVAVAFAPGQSALHFLWVPGVDYGTSTQSLEGYMRLGTLGLTGTAIRDPNASDAVPFPFLSLVNLPQTSALVDGTSPVAVRAVAQRRDEDAFVQRMLVALEPVGAPQDWTRLLVFDVRPGLPDPEAETVQTSSVSVTPRGSLTFLEVVATATVGPGIRELVRLQDGTYLATAAAPGPDGHAVTQIEVPGFGDTSSVASHRLAVGGPVQGLIPLSAGDDPAPGERPGFIALRADEALADVFACPSVPCERVQTRFESPYGTPDEDGVLAVRDPPAVTGAFGDVREALIVSTADGTARLYEPGEPGGVTLLAHRDSVVSFLVGTVDDLQVATTREAEFEPTAGAPGRAPLPRIQALFARTPNADATEVEDCEVTPEPDAPPTLACTEVALPPEAGRCPGVQTRELPSDAFFRFSYRGELASGFGSEGVELSDGCQGDGRCIRVDFSVISSLGDRTSRLFRSAVDPSEGVGPGEPDRVDLYLTCRTRESPEDPEAPDAPTLLEPTDLEIAYDGESALELNRVETRAFLARELQAPDVRIRDAINTSPAPDGFDYVSECDLSTLRVFAYRAYPAEAEAVLATESSDGTVVGVLQRVRTASVARFDTDQVSFTWMSPNGGFACETLVDRPTEPKPETVGSGFPCSTRDECGIGRACVPSQRAGCPGSCTDFCQSADRCFIGLRFRVCPEGELRINGAGPLVRDLRRASDEGPPLAALPDDTVFVEPRQSFYTSFPGSRSLREVRLTPEGLADDIID